MHKAQESAQEEPVQEEHVQQDRAGVQVTRRRAPGGAARPPAMTDKLGGCVRVPPSLPTRTLDNYCVTACLSLIELV